MVKRETQVRASPSLRLVLLLRDSILTVMLLAIDGATLAVHLTFEPGTLAWAYTPAAHSRESLIGPDPCEPRLEPSGFTAGQLPIPDALIDALLFAVLAPVDSGHRDCTQTENEYRCHHQACCLSHAQTSFHRIEASVLRQYDEAVRMKVGKLLESASPRALRSFASLR